ncbi:hypothetical protein FBU30_010003 [Linnemannia zychae]|nr:hypothetical protein FBU30_010003 [Linnemannia zychae]
MLATFNNIWKRSASGVMAASTKATALRPAVSSTVAMIARRHYSSSPSSSSDMMSQDYSSLVSSSEKRFQFGVMNRADLACDSFFALHRPLLGFNNNSLEIIAQQGHEGKFIEFIQCLYTASSYSHVDSNQIIKDFFRQDESKAAIMLAIDGQAPATPVQSIMDELDDTNVMHMTSVLRKRKIKMRKHKYKKLRKRTRALRKKLGK